MIKLADLTENPKNSRAISDEPVGNAAEMRDVLKPWIAFAEWLLANAGKDGLGRSIQENGPTIRQRLEELRAALAAPPRNCDVGTAEEQTRRMAAEYCAVQKSCYESPSGRQCPLYKEGVDCRLIWAQMPYEAQEGAGT